MAFLDLNTDRTPNRDPGATHQPAGSSSSSTALLPSSGASSSTGARGAELLATAAALPSSSQGTVSWLFSSAIAAGGSVLCKGCEGLKSVGVTIASGAMYSRDKVWEGAKFVGAKSAARIGTYGVDLQKIRSSYSQKINRYHKLDQIKVFSKAAGLDLLNLATSCEFAFRGGDAIKGIIQRSPELFSEMGQTVGLIIMANLLEYTSNKLEERGIQKKEISLIDIVDELLRLINAHIEELHPHINRIDLIADEKEQQRQLEDQLSSVTHSILDAALPGKQAELPVWSQLQGFLYSQLKKLIIAKVADIYREVDGPLTQNHVQTIIERPGGEKLVECAGKLVKRVVSKPGAFIEMMDPGALIADQLSLSKDVQAYIASWFRNQIVNLGDVEGVGYTALWQLIEKYSENIILHAIVNVVRNDADEDCHVLGTVIDKLWGPWNQFYSVNGERIRHEVNSCRERGLDPSKSLVLLETFKEFSDEVLQILGLDQSVLLPVPSMFRETLSDQMEKHAPSLLLKTYLAYVENPDQLEKYLEEFLPTPVYRLEDVMIDTLSVIATKENENPDIAHIAGNDFWTRLHNLFLHKVTKDGGIEDFSAFTKEALIVLGLEGPEQLAELSMFKKHSYDLILRELPVFLKKGFNAYRSGEQQWLAFSQSFGLNEELQNLTGKLGLRVASEVVTDRIIEYVQQAFVVPDDTTANKVNKVLCSFGIGAMSSNVIKTLLADVSTRENGISLAVWNVVRGSVIDQMYHLFLNTAKDGVQERIEDATKRFLKTFLGDYAQLFSEHGAELSAGYKEVKEGRRNADAAIAISIKAFVHRFTRVPLNEEKQKNLEGYARDARSLVLFDAKSDVNAILDRLTLNVVPVICSDLEIENSIRGQLQDTFSVVLNKLLNGEFDQLTEDRVLAQFNEYAEDVVAQRLTLFSLKFKEVFQQHKRADELLNNKIAMMFSPFSKKALEMADIDNPAMQKLPEEIIFQLKGWVKSTILPQMLYDYYALVMDPMHRPKPEMDYAQAPGVVKFKEICDELPIQFRTFIPQALDGVAGQAADIAKGVLPKKLLEDHEDETTQWLTDLIKELTASEDPVAKQLWSFAGEYLGNVIEHFVANAVGEKTVDGMSAVGVVVDKVMTVFTEFSEEHLAIIDAEIADLRKKGKDPTEDGKLIQKFQPLVEQLQQTFSLDNPVKLGLPEGSKDWLVNSLNETGPKLLLSIYHQYAYDPDNLIQFLQHKLQTPNLSDDVSKKIQALENGDGLDNIAKVVTANVIPSLKHYLNQSTPELANSFHQSLINNGWGGVQTKWVELLFKTLSNPKSEATKAVWEQAQNYLENLFSFALVHLATDGIDIKNLKTKDATASATSRLLELMNANFDENKDSIAVFVANLNKQIQQQKRSAIHSFAASSADSIKKALDPKEKSLITELAETGYRMINPDEKVNVEQTLEKFTKLAVKTAAIDLEKAQKGYKKAVKKVFQQLIFHYLATRKPEDLDSVKKTIIDAGGKDYADSLAKVYSTFVKQSDNNIEAQQHFTHELKRIFGPLTKAIIEKTNLKEAVGDAVPEAVKTFIFDRLQDSVLPQLVFDYYNDITEPQQQAAEAKLDLQQALFDDALFGEKLQTSEELIAQIVKLKLDGRKKDELILEKSGTQATVQQLENLSSVFGDEIKEIILRYLQTNSGNVIEMLNELLPYEQFDEETQKSLAETIKAIADQDNAAAPLISYLGTFIEQSLFKVLANLAITTPEKLDHDDGKHSKSTLGANIIVRFIDQFMKHAPAIKLKVSGHNKNDAEVTEAFQPLAKEMLDAVLPDLSKNLPVPASLKGSIAESIQTQLFPQLLASIYYDINKWTDVIPDLKVRLKGLYSDSELPETVCEEVAHFVRDFLPFEVSESKDDYAKNAIQALIDHLQSGGGKQPQALLSLIGFLKDPENPSADMVADNIEKLVNSKEVSLQQFWPVIQQYVEGILLKMFTEFSSQTQDFEDKGRKNGDNNALIDMTLSVLQITTNHFKLINDTVKGSKKQHAHQVDEKTMLNGLNGARHPGDTIDGDPKEQAMKNFFIPLADKLLDLININKPEDMPFPAPMNEQIFDTFKNKLLPVILEGIYDKMLSKDMRDMLMLNTLEMINDAVGTMSPDDVPPPDYEQDLKSQCETLLNHLINSCTDKQVVHSHEDKVILKQMFSQRALEIVHLQIYDEQKALIKEFASSGKNLGVITDPKEKARNQDGLAKTAVELALCEKKVSDTKRAFLEKWFKVALSNALKTKGDEAAIQEVIKKFDSKVRRYISKGTLGRLKEMILQLRKNTLTVVATENKQEAQDLAFKQLREYLFYKLNCRLKNKQTKIIEEFAIWAVDEKHFKKGAINKDFNILLQQLLAEFGTSARQIYCVDDQEKLDQLGTQFGETVVKHFEDKLDGNLAEVKNVIIKECCSELMTQKTHEVLHQKKANRHCGKMVKEFIGLVPFWTAKFLYNNIDCVNERPAEAIGMALRQTLKNRSLLGFIKDGIEKGLPHIKESRSNLGQEVADVDLSAQLLITLATTITKQVRSVVKSFFVGSWASFQGFLDEKINFYFGALGDTVKKVLDTIFHKIFIDLVGTALKILLYPLDRLIYWIVYLISKQKSKHIIKNLHHGMGKSLAFNITDNILKKLARERAAVKPE